VWFAFVEDDKLHLEVMWRWNSSICLNFEKKSVGFSRIAPTFAQSDSKTENGEEKGNENESQRKKNIKVDDEDNGINANDNAKKAVSKSENKTANVKPEKRKKGTEVRVEVFLELLLLDALVLFLVLKFKAYETATKTSKALKNIEMGANCCAQRRARQCLVFESADSEGTGYEESEKKKMENIQMCRGR